MRLLPLNLKNARKQYEWLPHHDGYCLSSYNHSVFIFTVLKNQFEYWITTVIFDVQHIFCINTVLVYVSDIFVIWKSRFVSDRQFPKFAIYKKRTYSVILKVRYSLGLNTLFYIISVGYLQGRGQY